jgi:hypothetical protein
VGGIHAVRPDLVIGLRHRTVEQSLAPEPRLQGVQ